MGERMRLRFGALLWGEDRQDAWIEVEERSVGIFVITDDGVTDHRRRRKPLIHETSLVLGDWCEDEVEDLDVGWCRSDEASLFGKSLHLRWRDVEIDLRWFLAPDSARVIHDPSVEHVREALQRVVFEAFCMGDI